MRRSLVRGRKVPKVCPNSGWMQIDSRLRCLTHSCLDLYIFMMFFNYKQCFKNEDKVILLFICFLSIVTNPAVGITISYVIVRNF